MDNLYSSPQLFKELLSKKTYACDIVRSNRRGLPPGYSSTANTLKRADRGEQVSFQDGPLLVIACKDTKVVQMLSTCTTDDVITVNRPVGLQVKYVPCPTTVVKYNNNMGGVNLRDQLMSYYAMSCCTQRWWLKLTFNLLENAVVNAYILAKGVSSTDNLTQLSFRKQLAVKLCKVSSQPVTPANIGRP